MPFAFGVEPAFEELAIRKGKTFRRVIQLFTDPDLTEPLVLTGLKVRLVFEGWVTLLEGAGLSVNATTGTVSVLLSPAQTGEVPFEKSRWVLEVEETAEELVDVLEGPVVASSP